MRPEVVERRLNSLPELSCRGKPINGLFRLLVGSDLIWERAYADVASNKGALTAGVEPANTLDGFSLERIARIRAMLAGGAYRFRPVRRVNIPKPDGRARPLGIPTWRASNSMFWPHGNRPTTRWTISGSGHASAKARM